MTPTTFEIKNAETSTTATMQNAIGDINEISAEKILTKDGKDVKTNFLLPKTYLMQVTRRIYNIKPIEVFMERLKYGRSPKTVYLMKIFYDLLPLIHWEILSILTTKQIDLLTILQKLDRIKKK